MVVIRPATVEDASNIARVHIDAWLSTYRGQMPDGLLDSLSVDIQTSKWIATLNQPKRTSTAVAEEDGSIVGFVSCGPEVGNDRKYQGELYAIYVLQSHQRAGIGRLLVRETAQTLWRQNFPNMLLWVLSTNPARHFYERLGGQYLRDRTVEFGGALLRESAYGWPDIRPLLDLK